MCKSATRFTVHVMNRIDIKIEVWAVLSHYLKVKHNHSACTTQLLIMKAAKAFYCEKTLQFFDLIISKLVYFDSKVEKVVCLFINIETGSVVCVLILQQSKIAKEGFLLWSQPKKCRLCLMHFYSGKPRWVSSSSPWPSHFCKITSCSVKRIYFKMWEIVP